MRIIEKIPRPLRLVFKAVSGEHARSQLHRLDYQIEQLLATFQHHLKFSPQSTSARIRALIPVTARLTKRPHILCYPDLPGPGSVFYKLCLHQGYGISNDPSSSFDAAIKWQDTTYPSNDPIIQKIASQKSVVNFNLTDISKGHVSRVFARVFGYELAVDPRTFKGPILRKSETNAAHDGVILNGPIIGPLPANYVYQRLVDNVKEEKSIDLRVPIFGTKIPFVRVKYRPIDKRFEHAGISQIADEVHAPESVFSREELNRIIEMCSQMGLEYGELDVVRDQGDGSIYVVDVNSTPTGPTFVSASPETVKQCFTQMGEALHAYLFDRKKQATPFTTLKS